LTVAYSSAGVPLWTNRYATPDFGAAAYDVAADATGNVFVAGMSADFNGYYWTMIKYSSAGGPLWTNRYRPPGTGWDGGYPRRMAADTNGNAFATGWKGNGSDNDYLTVKYSSAGAVLWTRSYNGPGNGLDQVQAIAVDPSGSVVVTGSSPGIESNDDYATIKYSSAGVPLWTNRYNGPGGWQGPGKAFDSVHALAVDGEGNVIVAGRSEGGTNVYSYATIKYSSAGTALWTNRYNGREMTTLPQPWPLTPPIM
jgi:hypothetical protein